MYFHVDESGNTGNNLFDLSQPRLSYGVLSSTKNVDALCVKTHKKIQKVIGDDQIHANALGIGGLVEISPYLIEIQNKMKFDFDYYFIEKPDYALVQFFDSVFDAGLNEAVKWELYWTPLRYKIIHKLSILFDEPLLQESWRLCIEKRIENHAQDIVNLLSELKGRVIHSGLDARSIGVITDAFDYGIENPLSLDFGYPDQKMVSPNAVGFQFVVSSIARRLRQKRRKNASSIIIDRQQQFNKAQIETHYNRSLIAKSIKRSSQGDKDYYLNHPLYVTMNKDDIIHKGLPDREMTISKSINSIGLQIVDVYLWVANKLISGERLPRELWDLWLLFSHRVNVDGISLEGMKNRFLEYEKVLPKYEDLTKEQLNFAQKSVQKHRDKVQGIKSA